MIVPDHVRANSVPLFHDVIAERTRRAHGARQRERAKFELVRAVRFPRPSPPIAVDARGQPSIRVELDGELRAVIGRQYRAIASLELDKLPECTRESAGRRRDSPLRACGERGHSLPIATKPAAQRLVAGRLDLPALVAALRQRYGGRITIEPGSAAIAEGGEACSANAVCDVGFRDLHVLPDGSVTRCRYLPGRDEMRVRSLREQSILEIWNGRPLAQLNNPREARYGSSPCVGCTEFAGCNGRGRCYYTALSRSASVLRAGRLLPKGERPLKPTLDKRWRLVIHAPTG